MILEIDERVTGISHDHLVNILHAENVLARRYFYPGCNRMEPYRTKQAHVGKSLPETEKLASQILALPTGTSVGQDEIVRIAQIIRLVLAKSQEIVEQLIGHILAALNDESQRFYTCL